LYVTLSIQALWNIITMSNINVITSNFLNAKSIIRFEDGSFKYGDKNFPNDFTLIECSEIEDLTYQKPNRHSDAHRRNGLFSAVKNVFSAGLSMKKGTQIEFNVRFKDGTYLAGTTSMDEYFEIQNAWLEVK